MVHRRFINITCAAMCLMWLGGSRSAATTMVDIPQTPDQPLDRPVLLPLFPLNMVVFPGQSLLLHIFEPRYRELIGDCARHGITFGISPLLSHGLANYGTEVEFAGVLSTDETGNMDVALEGMRVFRLHEFRSDFSGKLYSGGLVRFQANDTSYRPAIQDRLVSQYSRWLDRSGAPPMLAGEFPGSLSFAIGHHLGLSTLQKVQLIALSKETDRQAFLSRHLDRVLANNPG
jgi:ATP-dependent Lon protease